MPVMDVDETEWPLLVQTFDGHQSDGDLAYFEGRMLDVFARNEEFVTLCLVRKYDTNFVHIRRLGEFTKEHRGAFQLNCKGSAIVIPSPSFRFILSSFYLMVPMPHPTLVCEDVARAEPWLVHRLKEAKLPIPPCLQTPGTLAGRFGDQLAPSTGA
jgi:hypothetical protein